MLKVGRPKRQFSNKEIQLIEQYARNNCHNRTIGTALSIAINTLERNFGTKIRLWRAQGKVELREMQRNLAKTSSDMSKFLGKNELNQVDKQVFETKVEPVVVPDDQKAAYKAAAQTLRFKLAQETA